MRTTTMTNVRIGRVTIGLLLGIGVIAVVAGVLGYAARPYLNRTSTNPTPGNVADNSAPSALTIAALGRIAPAGGVIPVYGPPGDRVERLADDLKPGKRLESGAMIAHLASRKERSTELAVAESQFREAEQQLEYAKATGELRLAAADLEAKQATADEELDRQSLQQQIDILNKQYQVAMTQYQRLTQLNDMNVRIPAEEREQAELLLAKATAERDAARLNLEKLTTKYARAKELANAKLEQARSELKEAIARVPIDSARQKVELARQVFALTEIRAPVQGHVLKVMQNVGEPTSAQQPILYMANTDQMVVIAEVYETDVYRLREALNANQAIKARVSSPAFPRETTLQGRLSKESQISRMIARNAIFAVSPREDIDRRVVEVEIELNPEAQELAARLVGLQVSVILEPEIEP